jgi:hypothetical protein
LHDVREQRPAHHLYDPEAEVILLSVERVVEMEEFWEFMKKTHRSLRPGSVEKS